MALDDFERFDFAHNGQVRPVERPSPVLVPARQWPVWGDFRPIFLREGRNKTSTTETMREKDAKSALN